jgi:hypothetical protein
MPREKTVEEYLPGGIGGQMSWDYEMARVSVDNAMVELTDIQYQALVREFSMTLRNKTVQRSHVALFVEMMNGGSMKLLSRGD